MITLDNRSSRVSSVQPNSRVRPFLGLGVYRPRITGILPVLRVGSEMVTEEVKNGLAQL